MLSRLLSVTLPACLCLALLCGGSRLPDAAAQQPREAEGAKPKYLGADVCKTCHEKPQLKSDYVLLTEWATWKNEDKHSQAYDVLTQELGKHIGEILRINPTTDAKCLNCHAMNFPKDRHGDNFRLSDGVTCDGCHGPAEQWLGPHIQRGWRTKPAEEKAKLGMVNMRDPVRRSEMCLSCHMGSVPEDKIVTHAMYVAGHPPLPGFELDTFSHALPPHWRALKDKPEDVRKAVGYDPTQDPRVRNVAVGGVLNLRESVRLLAAQAKTDSWPEYAQFDCASCHHELRRASATDLRASPWGLGRPRPPTWPEALVPAVIEATAAGEAEAKAQLDQFHRHLRQMQGAFAAQPFGDRERVAASARAMDTWAGGLLDQLRGRKIDRAQAERLLRHLAAANRAAPPDYASARELAWALRDVYSQVGADATVRNVLADLNKELSLDLPSGRQQRILDALPARFQAERRYDPDRLLDRLDEIRRLLPNR